MTKPNHVVSIVLDKSESITECEDRFKFRRERGWAWLQYLCFSILRRLRCFDEEITVTYERHEIEGEKLLDKLLKQNEVVARHLQQYGRFRLLIGTEDYACLMDEAVSSQAFVFTTQERGGRNGAPTIFGMEICVIPWMRGSVVLPQDFRW